MAVALACGISKQYLCDIEKGRRGGRLDTLTAAKLAACLDIPLTEVTSRADKLTDRVRRQYSEYHRVLRSNARAEQALTHMQALREISGNLKVALYNGKDARKLLQLLETTISQLDSTLAYRSPRPKRWAQVQGDDLKLAPGRRPINWDKVG